MSRRKAFNKYSTIAEKLNYLNKEKNKAITENYDVNNIAQSFNFSEENNIQSDVPISNIGSTQAFIYEGLVQNSNGYSNQLTVDSDNGVLGVPCRVAISKSVSITNEGFWYTTTESNPQPNLLENISGRLFTLSHTSGGKNYYSIDEGNLVAGAYDLLTVAYAYSLSSLTLTLDKEIYLTNGEEVLAYGDIIIS